MKYLIIFSCFGFFSSLFCPIQAQNNANQTISKSCGNCRKAVSAQSRVGQTCPHCHVKWGQENTTKTTSQSKTNTLNQKNGVSRQGTTNSSNPKTNATNGNQNRFTSLNRDETEKFLIQKLKEYSIDYSSSNSYMGLYTFSNYCDFEFKLTKEYLIISYLYDYHQNFLVYVPWYDISSIHGTRYEKSFSISTLNNSMYILNTTKNEKVTGNFVKIGFKNDAETDIVKDIESAFLRLKVLSSKPLNNDLPSFTPSWLINRPSIEDTQNWIIEKLNKYSVNLTEYPANGLVPSSSYSSNEIYSNFRYEFTKEGYLKVMYYENNRSKTAIINLCLVETKPGSSGQKTDANILFWCKTNTILVNNDYKSSFAIKINFQGEENLQLRLFRAFNNLKSYCPKEVIKKETF